jgi:hypothetical protein
MNNITIKKTHSRLLAPRSIKKDDEIFKLPSDVIFNSITTNTLNTQGKTTLNETCINSTLVVQDKATLNETCINSTLTILGNTCLGNIKYGTTTIVSLTPSSSDVENYRFWYTTISGNMILPIISDGYMITIYNNSGADILTDDINGTTINNGTTCSFVRINSNWIKI